MVQRGWSYSLYQNYEPSNFPEVLYFDILSKGRRTRNNDKLKLMKEILKSGIGIYMMNLL